jgi:hypothetical protein
VIPPFDPATGNLPPGEYRATWHELTERFGRTEWRAGLLNGLKAALVVLKAAGCRTVYLDGSFVTAKERPGDYDGCWDAEGVDFDLLEQTAPALLTFDDERAAQKAAYGGELFVADWGAGPIGTLFREFFKSDRDGNPKGIVVIDLKDLP